MAIDPQQQRIMGYFIEEAWEHLDTIDKGLNNLANVVVNKEATLELYRAAHSIKGGAAMLGIDSVRLIAYYLEDFFKVIKENSHIPVDQELVDLFLEGYAHLPQLLKRLSENGEIPEPMSQMAIESGTTTMERLGAYLHQLLQAPEGETGTTGVLIAPIEQFTAVVNAIIQEMTTHLGYPRTEERVAALHTLCDELHQWGDYLEQANWNGLVEIARAVISNPFNSFEAIVAILPDDLTTASQLVMENRSAEILPSVTLQELLSPDSIDETADEQTSNIFSALPIAETEDEETDLLVDQSQQVELIFGSADIRDRMGWTSIETETTSTNAPLPIGNAEMTTLAQLFQQDQLNIVLASEDMESEGTIYAMPIEEFPEDGTNFLEVPPPTDTNPPLANESFTSPISDFDYAPDYPEAQPSEASDLPTDYAQVADAPSQLGLNSLLNFDTFDYPPNDLAEDNNPPDPIPPDRADDAFLLELSPPVTAEEVMPAYEDTEEEALIGFFVEDEIGSELSLFSQAPTDEDTGITYLQMDDQDIPSNIFGETAEAGQSGIGLAEFPFAVDFQQADPDAESAYFAELPEQTAKAGIPDDFPLPPMDEPDLPDLQFSLQPFPARLDDFSEFFGVDDVDDNGSIPLAEPADAESVPVAAELTNELADLEALIDSSNLDNAYADLESLIDDRAPDMLLEDTFDLGALLGLPDPAPDFQATKPVVPEARMNVFTVPQELGTGRSKPISLAPAKSSPSLKVNNVRVDVRYLDSLNNLVGELVVNRNLLGQDQERLQNFLTTLLSRVQELSDVSQRMRDQYDRSLLETSVAVGRSRNQAFTALALGGATGDIAQGFDNIEFDRYNAFHILSQEIIELIVKIKESASDIEFVITETEQVSRELGRIANQIQDDLKQSRMVPFANLADRLPRGVRDRAIQSGKQAELVVIGGDTLIDKSILEQLVDPMTHLVNNAVDHGLESPEERKKAGKAVQGMIEVKAYHQGNQTLITVRDNGGGIDPERVKKKALEKGLITPKELARMTANEAYELLFMAGFSTKDMADQFAGRGVGLDVVKNCLDNIRGSIYVDSQLGKGTQFTIRLPLTLSISKAIFCISDRVRVAIPVDGFEDMVELPRSQVIQNNIGQDCILWQETMLPFQPLANLLSFNRKATGLAPRSGMYVQENEEICVIIVRDSENNFLGVKVDQFLGEYEIVVKQLEGPVNRPPGIAGATVLGDGRVISIVNVLELFDIDRGRLQRPNIRMELPPDLNLEASQPIVLIVDDSIVVREMLSATFSKVGYFVEVARDGQDAYDKLRGGLPCDLIFCDIEMPKMDGMQLLATLQKDEQLSRIPIAMLTSRGAEKHRQTAIQLGAKAYFTKPYLEEELLTASQRLLKGEVLV